MPKPDTHYVIVWIIALLLSIGAHPAAKSAKPTRPDKPAIASAHPLATEAGFAILEQGGNAFDAAVAVAATLAVVEPFGSGLGGGGFFLLHRAKGNTALMLDARETAPLAASENMYLDADGQVQSELSKQGPLSAGIPGIPAALEHLAQHYGKLPLATSLAPAIAAARDGFAVSERYQHLVEMRLSVLQQYPAAASIFLSDNQVPELGHNIVQPELAQTLTRIAEQGAAGFYTGAIAERLVDGVQAAGGLWSLQDLSEYRVIEREPVQGEYRRMRITSAALPSSGGVVLVNALNILSNYQLDELTSVQRTHVIIEAMRRAYRERAEYLGDSDFVDVPLRRLLNPDYAAGLAASIRLDAATASASLPGGIGKLPAGDNTTHFSVLDRRGNRVAATLSINYPFGSGFVVPATGVLLNNEMDDFAAKPGVPNGYGLVAGRNNPNAIQPGKRMLSSMSPSFIEFEDRIAILGTPGGSRIISMVLLAMLAFYDGADAGTIVALPRFHHQFLPDKVSFEPNAFNHNLRLELQLLGHQLAPMSRQYGNMQVIVWDRNTNTVSAAADPRGEGLAAVR